MTVTAATPSPTPTAQLTPVPTNTPSPATAAPIATITPTQIPVATQTPTVTANTDVIDHRGAGAGAIIATVLVGIFTAAIAAILVLYTRGKLDLSWLEEKLEKKVSKQEKSDKNSRE